MLLIIGSSSFIGRHLAQELLSRELDVAGTYWNTPAAERQDYDAFQLDILDRERCREVIAEVQPEVVFHLAAQTVPRESRANPQHCYRVNIGGTANIAEACAALETPPVLVFPSSVHVYGPGAPTDRGIKESDPCRPATPYGIAKLAAEQHLLSVAGDRLRVVIFRLFNQFGPGQSGPFFIPDMVKAIRNLRGLGAPRQEISSPAAERQETSCRGAPRPHVIETGNIQVRRDFLDVRDAARAMAQVTDPDRASAMSGNIYNLGRGEALPLADILEMMFDAAGVSATFETDPAKLRPSDPEALWADISKLQADTGWRPEREMEDSLADVIQKDDE
jgi:GDP-4-dehydro-6-deoxy-D-mannose reductase